MRDDTFDTVLCLRVLSVTRDYHLPSQHRKLLHMSARKKL